MLVSVLVIIMAPGCSTLEVFDGYTSGGTYQVIDRREGVEIAVGVKRDRRFLSVGPPLIPLIPISIGKAKQSSIHLEVDLELKKDQDFTFFHRPCLSIASDKTLCPSTITMVAIGMYKEGPYFRKIREFERYYTHPLIIPTSREDGRLTRQQVYDHYEYTGKQQWDWLRVTLNYEYPCGETCPKSFSLRGTDVISAAKTDILAGDYLFERARQNDYQFVRELQ